MTDDVFHQIFIHLSQPFGIPPAHGFDRFIKILFHLDQVGIKSCFKACRSSGQKFGGGKFLLTKFKYSCLGSVDQFQILDNAGQLHHFIVKRVQPFL